jgi:hypothetical protein
MTALFIASYGLPTLDGSASACACVVMIVPGGTNLLSAIVTPSVIVLDTQCFDI